MHTGSARKEKRKWDENACCNLLLPVHCSELLRIFKTYETRFFGRSASYYRAYELHSGVQQDTKILKYTMTLFLVYFWRSLTWKSHGQCTFTHNRWRISNSKQFTACSHVTPTSTASWHRQRQTSRQASDSDEIRTVSHCEVFWRIGSSKQFVACSSHDPTSTAVWRQIFWQEGTASQAVTCLCPVNK